MAGNRAAGLAWASGLADLPRRQTRCFPLNSLYHNIVITRVQKSAAPTDALRLREMLRCHRLGGHYAALGVRGASPTQSSFRNSQARKSSEGMDDRNGVWQA